jgi:serine/threonine protein kinase
MPLSTGERLGRYEIVELLGEGSMGEVYRARDTRLGRDVAVKVLRPEFACEPERLGRFEREARAASALNHPNVVSLFDVGEHDGSPYLVTEVLEGETLRERLDRGRLPPREALAVAIQVAAGLVAAHGKGIVHRDLKPENVFLLPDGRIKVLDFGLAKLFDPGDAEGGIDGGENPVVTTAGTVLGTVEYMSPEQLRGQPADHRADLHALGAVLFEMLAGRQPFHRASATETFQAILEEEPPKLARSGVQVSAELEDLVRKSLQKSPEARFQSARELSTALERIAAAPAAESEPKGSSRTVLVVVAIAVLALVAVIAARAL